MSRLNPLSRSSTGRNGESARHMSPTWLNQSLTRTTSGGPSPQWRKATAPSREEPYSTSETWRIAELLVEGLPLKCTGRSMRHEAEGGFAMPYAVRSMLRVNEVLATLEGFEPEALLAAIAGADTVLDGADALGLFDVLDAENADSLRRFFGSVPASLDAAVLAGIRSALGRGVRIQVTWQPGYDFELRLWEASEGSSGLFNIHVLSPHPPEIVPPG